MDTFFTRRQILSILAVIILTCFSLELTEYGMLSSSFYHESMAKFHSFIVTYHYKSATIEDLKCPDVGKGMTRGKWKPRPLTPIEKVTIETFLHKIRTAYGMPNTMQRSDGKCGNASYSPWFRAICNPKGDTPCCYDGKCVNKTIADCKCSHCYDLRSQTHAEYAKWEPDDPRCGVKIFTTEEACHLLQGAQILVAGDSLMRHIYTALLLVLANHDYEKIWNPKFPKDLHDKCTGMYIFGEKICRRSMRKLATFCHGNTSVLLMNHYHFTQKAAFHSYVRSKVNKSRTFVLTSIGLHDSFNKSVYKEFILPAIETIKNKSSEWPKLIWTTIHHFGILKSNSVSKQSNAKVKIFNDFMVEKLRQHNIPILDTFNLTDSVMSPDGAHYGLGVNVMKAQMFLNLLQQMKDRGQW